MKGYKTPLKCIFNMRWINDVYGKSGFTLTELMIALAIMVILAAIALPSYKYYENRSRKVEAKTNLATLALLLEEYNSLYGRYCPDCTDDSTHHIYSYREDDTGNATTDTITNWLDIKPKQAAKGNFEGNTVVCYDYTIDATSNSYKITATPVRCDLSNVLTIDQDGKKTDGTKNGW